MRLSLRFHIIVGLCSILTTFGYADSVQIAASQDTTIFANNTNLSNGAFTRIFVGQNRTGLLRRAPIHFDVASDVPVGATVTSAVLRMTMDRTPVAAMTINIHKLSSDWGEAGSFATVMQGGQGDQAEPGDATWAHKFYSTSTWTTAGGDFVAGSSAGTAVGASASYFWTNAQMVTDVQDWLDTPANNSGWIAIGNEGAWSVKRFHSHEGANPNGPQLFVGFVTTTTTTTSSTTSTSTLTPPVIVDIDADVTLWAVYTPTGTIVPMYSTNLGTTPIEWLTVPIFTNTPIGGTNRIEFDPPDTNSSALYFHLRQDLPTTTSSTTSTSTTSTTTTTTTTSTTSTTTSSTTTTTTTSSTTSSTTTSSTTTTTSTTSTTTSSTSSTTTSTTTSSTTTTTTTSSSTTTTIPQLVQEPPRNPSFGIDDGDQCGGVLLHSGEHVLRRYDMFVKGRRMEFRFIRTYRSGRTNETAMGHGWDANIFTRLERQPNGDMRRFPGNGRSDLYVVQTNGTFVSPLGFYTRLVTNATGSELRNEHGLTYTYDTLGRVTGREDRIGNRFEYAYTNANGRVSDVTDEFGRRIHCEYDSLDRLIKVSDFTGRECVYTYDASNNLVSARSPTITGTPHANDFPSGKTERYEYDTSKSDPRLAHNLIHVIAPNEVNNGSLTPRTIYTYGQAGTTYDRVISCLVGGINTNGVSAGGTLTYTYDLSPSGGPAGTATKTTVSDRNSNDTDYFYDGVGHCLRAVEEPATAAFTNEMVYNVHGELVSHSRPEGDSTGCVYDDGNLDVFQQGNLLSKTHLPGSRGGDQVSIQRTHSYEPLFNRLLTTVEPRGNDATYVPQNGGVQSALRYTSSNTYDYMEGSIVPAEATVWGITIPAALLNFGDVNADGVTTQHMGNRVHAALPTASLALAPNQAAAEGDPNQEIVTTRQYNDFGQLTRLDDPRGNVDTYDYYPENDPDGDGLNIITGRNSTVGGYIRQYTEDALVGPSRQDPLPLSAITNSYQYDPRGNRTVRTDGRGQEHHMTYNELDQVIITEDPKVDAGQPDGYLRRFHYDANDNVVKNDIENETTDTNTHASVVVTAHPFIEHRSIYDILDNRIERTQDATRDASIPASGQPESLVTRFRYDANENQVNALSPLAVDGTDTNNVVIIVYDARDLVFSVTQGGSSSNASTTTYDYDRNRNLVRKTDAEDNDGPAGPESDTHTYDGYDRPISETDRAGNVTTNRYDPAGNRVRYEFYGPADGASSNNVLLTFVDCRYDELSRVVSVDQGLFVATGVVLIVSSPPTEGPLDPGDGALNERTEYDALNRRTFRTEDDGFTYESRYDGADRVIHHITPMVDTVTFGGPFHTEMVIIYDANDNVVRTEEIHSNPNGIQPPATLERYSVFDALDRVTRETDPEGNTRRHEYDSRDNLVSTYDGRGPQIADPLGLYTNGTINDFGNARRISYDSINRVWTKKKELTTTGEGGAPPDLGNPSNPDGQITRNTVYDANSRVIEQTDDNGATTISSYDSINRLTGQVNADGGTRVHVYDRDHNVTQTTDENNTVHTFTYDGLNRRTRRDVNPDPARTVAGGTLPMIVGTTVQRWRYDGLSRITEAFDNNDAGDPGDDWTVFSRYDSLSRCLEENQNGAIVACEYNSDDRSALHYPGAARTLRCIYDPLDQLNIVTSTPALFLAEEYLGYRDHPIATLQGLSAGAPSTQTDTILDANKDAVQAVTVAPMLGADIQVVNAQRNGNRDQDTFDVNRTPGTPSQRQDAYFLTQDSDNRTSGQVRDIFDFFGPAGSTDRAVEFSGRDEIISVTGAGVVPQSNNFNSVCERINPPYIYDGDGGLAGTGIRTEDATFVYQFDGLNRLRVVRDASTPAIVVAEYEYDSTPAVVGGRRVRKAVTNTTVFDGITRFYYDKDHCIEEQDGATSQTTRQYIFGGYSDAPLAMDVDTNADGNPDQLFFYVRDFNQNVTCLVNTNGQPFEFYAYDTYTQPEFYILPNPIVPQPFSQAGNPYLFGGTRYDVEVGLYYYGTCYYDPVDAEFISRDLPSFWSDSDNDGNPMTLLKGNLWNGKESPPPFISDDACSPSDHRGIVSRPPSLILMNSNSGSSGASAGQTGLRIEIGSCSSAGTKPPKTLYWDDGAPVDYVQFEFYLDGEIVDYIPMSAPSSSICDKMVVSDKSASTCIYWTSEPSRRFTCTVGPYYCSAPTYCTSGFTRSSAEAYCQSMYGSGLASLHDSSFQPYLQSLCESSTSAFIGLNAPAIAYAGEKARSSTSPFSYSVDFSCKPAAPLKTRPIVDDVTLLYTVPPTFHHYETIFER